MTKPKKPEVLGGVRSLANHTNGCKLPSMPKVLKVPDEQLVVRWICLVCKKTGLFTLPKKSSGTLPFECTLGIHRELSRDCKMKDVTMRGGQDGVLEVVLERGKSSKQRLTEHGT